MVHIRPFCATYYNPNQIDPLSDVLTPPYDVISPAQQAAFYERHSHNFIRLDFRQTGSEDSPYEAVAVELAQWLSDGVLIERDAPAFYFHRHRFSVDHQPYSRLSLIGLCELEPFAEGHVLPHEKTMDAPKVDRMNLMRATQAQLSAVWSLYQDPEHIIDTLFERHVVKTAPLLTFQDDSQGEHHLWACGDPAVLQQIQDWFQPRLLYIADGHHRYESALNFSQEGPAGSRFGLMYLSNVADPGLKVLPTHRLLTHQVQVPEWSDLLAQLSRTFTVQTVTRSELMAQMEQAAAAGNAAFGLLSATAACLLTAPKGMGEFTLPGRSAAYHQLDVAVLHEKILYQQLAFPAAKVKDTHYIRYSPDVAQIEQWLQEDAGQIALLLNATSVSELCAVADAHDTMPPKSTYFYPKIPSGMLLYRFENFS